MPSPRELLFPSFVALSAVLGISSACVSAGPADVNRTGWIRVERSSTWCGAKALWLIAQGYGLDVSLDEIKRLSDPEGTSGGVISLLAIARAAQGIGLSAQPVKCKLEWLRRTTVPMITVHDGYSRLKEADGVMHCLVLLKYEGGRFFVLDPFLPAEVVELTEGEFSKTWAGVAAVIGSPKDGIGTVVISGPSAAGYLCLLLLVVGVVVQRSNALCRGNGPLVSSTMGIVAICFTSGVIGCELQKGGNATDESPGLRFESQVFDTEIDPLEPGSTSITHEFAFENKSKSQCRIARIATTCTCAVAEFPKSRLLPGEKGVVTLTAHHGRQSGNFSAAGDVILEDSTVTPIRLTMRALIHPAIVLHPDRIVFGDVVAGELHIQRLSIEARCDAVSSMPRITVSSSSSEISVVTSSMEMCSDAPTRARLSADLSIKCPTAGTVLKSTVIVKNTDTGASRTCEVMANVVHPLFSVTPRLLNCATIPHSGVNRIIKFKRRTAGKGMPLVKVDCDDLPEVRVDSITGSEEQNETTVALSIKPSNRRFITGTLRATLDSDNENPILVSCVGYCDPVDNRSPSKTDDHK